jgi:hypothetical protein
MSSDRDRRFERLEDSLNLIDHAEYEARRASFTIDCLALIEEGMPLTAVRSFEVAKKYQAGLAPIRSVHDVLKRCRDELRDREIRRTDPEVAAIRAVIFLLQHQCKTEPDDFPDTVADSLRLMNIVEPHVSEQLALLQRHFGISAAADL